VPLRSPPAATTGEIIEPADSKLGSFSENELALNTPTCRNTFSTESVHKPVSNSPTPSGAGGTGQERHQIAQSISNGIIIKSVSYRFVLWTAAMFKPLTDHLLGILKRIATFVVIFWQRLPPAESFL
jgi:hypothetical protein